MPLSCGLGLGTRLAYFSISWQTNYDPTQMYLGLYQQRSDGSEQELWSQTVAGPLGGSGHIGYGMTVEGPVYYRINVVPEPSGACALALGLVPSALLALNRRRHHP